MYDPQAPSSALSGLGQKSETVSVEISESLPPIQTDPDLLERVIANLVENAVTWSVDKTVRVSAGEVAVRIELRISDRGPGIPTAARDIVFQPFERLGDAPKGEGVGLGLAVSRGLLEAMENKLIIEDTPGGGTTMVIELKVATAVEQPAGSAGTQLRG